MTLGNPYINGYALALSVSCSPSSRLHRALSADAGPYCAVQPAMGA
jgi:hypothetical protein